MINKIGKITLYVNNQDQALDFWTKKMGFVSDVKTMGPQMRWMEVKPNKNESTSFVLYDKKVMQQQNPKTNIGHPSVLLSTTDIQSTWSKMKENGVNVGDITSMQYGKMVIFKDLDGNDFILREDQ